MKIGLSNSLIRKFVAAMFAVAIVLLGVCFGSDDVTKVYAADLLSQLKIHESGDFYYVPFTDMDTVKASVGNQVPGTVDGYAFAGWYTDVDCTEAIKNDSQVDKATTDTFYAKYVPEDVLSTKVQISTKDVNAKDGEGVDTRNMRFVSSVDNLNYTSVGFALKYEETEGSNEWKKFKNEAKIVFERIESATEGDEYKFSPKVVDTKSEYFMTATWKGADNESGISQTDFDTNYYVRAYWVTLDGVTVYGPTRYVSVNDGLNTNIVNMSVKNSAWNEDTALTMSSYEGATVSVAYQDGTYAHLKIDLGTSINRADALKSVTQFTITNTADSTTEEAIYRNLYTKYTGTGTEDKSWYEVYGANAKEYVIATSADLYGLASLVNTPTYYFASQTIYVVSDIEVNKGRATESGWSTLEEDGTTAIDGATSHVWTPIGYQKYFAGTFDGQGHEISGINGTPTSATSECFVGLFGRVTGTVTNLRLTNSYFELAIDTSFLGSIAGRCDGNMSSIYSEAYLKNTYDYTGGIVGYTSTSAAKKIENCWYNGTITLSGNSGRLCGGIVGQQLQGTLEINNCLFSGNIVFDSVTATGSKNTGGLCGYSSIGLTITNSLNSGEISKENCSEDISLNAVGGVIGQIADAATNSVTIENVYYANKGITGTYKWYCAGTNSPTITGLPTNVEEADITGMRAYYNDVLVNTDAWVVTKTTPQLALFGEELVIPENVNLEWFTGLDKKEYTICNSADDNELNVAELYGFAFLSNAGINFEGSTVYMANDVTVNKGTVAEWEADGFTNLTEWTPIGEMTNEFAGTFDGQLNTIKGIYVNNTTEKGTGLFRSTAEGSSIENLKLENSYFYTNQQYGASVVGSCSGDLKNVYSNAVVKSTTAFVGGIAAEVWSSTSTEEARVQISNCWFDGELKTTGNHIGGLIGLASNGYVEMSNCLNTANMETEGAWIGGLCSRTIALADMKGTAASNGVNLQITNCLNAEALETSTTSYIGSIIGQADGTVIFSSVYGVNKDALPIGKGSESTDSESANMVNLEDITGVLAYDKCTFVNTDAWVVTETTPALALFAKELTVDGVDFSWYQGKSVTEYTICDEDTNEKNVAELYGFAYLCNHGITFADMEITLANSVTVNNGTVAEWEEKEFADLTEWTPIGILPSTPFAGTFIGKGNEISGIYALSTAPTAETYVGLFGYVTGNISDLRLTNSYFTGTSKNNRIGSIAGRCDGSIDSVFSDAVITNNNIYTGGIVAFVSGSAAKTINNCWYAGTMNLVGASATYAGGIVAQQFKGSLTISDCLFSGTINFLERTSNTDGFTGGICGDVRADLTIENSLNSGKFVLDKELGATNVYYIGRIIGRIQDVAFTVSANNVYYTNEGLGADIDWNQKGTSATIKDGIEPIQQAREDITGVLARYNGVLVDRETWVCTETTPALASFAEELTMPEGINIEWCDVAADNYTIDTADELMGFSYLSSLGVTFEGKMIYLGADIDLNEGWTAKETPEVPANIWTPIGTEKKPFAGTFDGQKYSISGVYVASADDYIGLFGVIGESSEVKNLRLLNSYFEQQVAPEGDGAELDGYVGSIAGWLQGDMDSIYSNAVVKSGNRYTGGLVSWVRRGDLSEPVKITNCWYDGQMVTGTYGRYIGGIAAGILNGTCNMENVLFTGKIDACYNGEKAIYLGGIVGEVKAIAQALNLTSVVSAGKIVGNHTSIQCNAVVGRVRIADIYNNNTVNASAANPQLNMENVFATRDCYGSPYGYDGTVYTGTKVITEAVTDDEGNIVTPAVTEEITAKVTVTGAVARTNGDDRLLGYIPNKTIQLDKENPVVSSLDFTEAWVMRTDGVPIPATLQDVVPGKISSVDAEALAKEIGLDYWNTEAKMTDVEDYGAGNYLVKYTPTTDLTYAGYLAKLVDLGFTKYADNSSSDMDDDGVDQATYKKDSPEWILNVTWVENESQIYISINTDKNSLDDNLVGATQEGSDAISLSMLEITNTEDDQYGNSFVFELPNGHFIVSDGGRVEDGMKLIDYMKELAGTTDGVQNPIYIDAWIITHYHGDHCGALAMFNDYPAYRENVYVDAIYVSEPSSYAADYWEADRVAVMNNIYKGISYLTKTDKVTRPNIYQMHMGQRYYFNGITMDVVDTQEQHPVATWADTNGKLPDPFNTSSTSCIFSFADGNGATKKTFIGGDATNVNLEYMMKAYGENNKTLANIDVFVALHHGHNTTATYGTQEVDHPLGIGTATVQGIANTNWADFLLNNANNTDQKFDAVLFPYYKVYELTWKTGGYQDHIGTKAYPYNIGDMNRYLYEDGKAAMYYTYGYQDMTDATEETPHGTVKLTFGTTIEATVLDSWK